MIHHLHRGASLSSGVLARPHVQKFLPQCSTRYNSPAMITGCIANILTAFLSLQILLQKVGILLLRMHLYKPLFSLACDQNLLLVCSHYHFTATTPAEVAHGKGR